MRTSAQQRTSTSETAVAASTLRVAIVVGSTRPGRRAGEVADWVHDIAEDRDDATFEVVDIADYALPDGTGADVMKLCTSATPKVCLLLTGHRTKNVDATGFHIALRKPIASDELIAVIKAHGAGM